MTSPPRLTRRTILGGLIGAAWPGTAGARQLQDLMPAGTAPKPNGPRVFLDYDQTELDASYDQSL